MCHALSKMPIDFKTRSQDIVDKDLQEGLFAGFYKSLSLPRQIFHIVNAIQHILNIHCVSYSFNGDCDIIL